MFETYRAIHFIGIGGIGMSGIAEVLWNLGYEVTGSDSKESDITKRLVKMGVRVHIGQREENIGNAHVAVVSSAVSDHNPEVIAAQKRSIPVIPRAEMLAELERLKYSILVAGAHGKTTVTSLISAILGFSGLDPTIIIGGKLKGIGTSAKLGQGKFLVAEADESDGSFLMLSPTIAVVTNIDREHMDFFKTMDHLNEAFLSFMNKVPFYGISFACMESDRLRELIPNIHRRCMTYGLSDVCDIYAKNIEQGFMSTRFSVVYGSDDLGSFSIPLPGLHNVLNALACIGVALELRIEPVKIKDALHLFSGIQRRFELKGEAKGVKIYDDYAHHPAEIRATITAARESMKQLGEQGRLFVIFQPHRYSRTADLMEEFSVCFRDTDFLVLIDIYPAGEEPVAGVSSKSLLEKMKQKVQTEIMYSPDREDAVKQVISRVRSGDILMTLGAGDVWTLGEKVLERLQND